MKLDEGVRMDIKILLLSTAVTISGYLLLIVYRYLKNDWQWSSLVPGKYIYPKRIKKIIRKSVLDAYKVKNTFYTVALEDNFQEQYRLLKNPSFSLTTSTTQIMKDVFSEQSFQIYLFLVTVNAIMDTGEKNGLRAEIASAKSRINMVNKIFSQRYVRKAISNRDRSVILAEVFYRNMQIGFDGNSFLAKGYENIRLKAVIQQYETLIDEVSKDPDIAYRARLFTLRHHPVLKIDENVMGESLLFMVYVTLMTKWL